MPEPTVDLRASAGAVLLSIGLLIYVVAGGSVLQRLGIEPAREHRTRPREVELPRIERAKTPEPLTLPARTDWCAQLARGGGPIAGLEGLPSGGLHHAAAMNDVERIELEARAPGVLDMVDEQGRSPLAWAVLLDKPQAVFALLRMGASTEARALYGETPLMLAARTGNRAVIEALLRAGAVASKVDVRQRTPLMLAAWGGHADAVAALADAGATLSASCAIGMTALHYAVHGPTCWASAEELLKRGAALEARDQEGATPLLRAIEKGSSYVAESLIERGADTNVRDYKGLGAFDYVARPRKLDDDHQAQLKLVLDLLIGAKADRRLGLDPRTQPILFRDELNALAEREGRPRLPELEHQQQVATRAAGTDQGATRAGRRLLRKLKAPASGTLPDVLLFRQSWSRAAGVARRVELRAIAPRGGQRLTLSGAKDGRTDWSLSGVLLVEAMSGGGRARSQLFIGAADEVHVSGERVQRFGRNASSFIAGELDVTDIFSTDRGAAHIVITALSYYRNFSISDLYLNVEGAGAEATAERFEIQQSIAEPAR